MAGLIERVKLQLQVDSATNTSDDPTPIYVLDELVAALSAGDTRSGVDAVCARLAHRSPVVKQKALKLVTHIGRKGAPDLRRLMARQSGAVRDLLHFRCDPDPFKGDTVWKRVQEYAQEALETIHGTPDAGAVPGPAQSTLGGRIQGFGSEGGGSYSGGGGGGGGGSGMMGFGSESAGGRGGSRMVGFGSADVMQSGMQAISSGMRSLSGNKDGYSSQLGSGSDYSSRLGLAASSGGGGFSQPIVQRGSLVSSSSSSTVTPPAGGAAPAGAAGAAGGQHPLEQRLVDRICTPAGLRAAPGSEDLRAFVDGLAPLDGTAVAQLLERKLEAGPWQATLRALCAVEAVVESGSSTACGQLAVHFQGQPDAVRRAAKSPQASVRQRAQKVLALLGAEGAGGTAAACAASGPAAAAPWNASQQLFTEDLLGVVEPAGESSSTEAGGLVADLLGEPAAPAPTAAPTAAPADLLAGLDFAMGPATGSSQAQHPTAHVQQQQQQQQQPAVAADDIFGGMMLGSGQPQVPAAATAPVPPLPPAQAPQSAASDLDLLGGLSVGPATSAASTTPAQQGSSNGLGDLLGGLSLSPAAGPSLASSSSPGLGAPMLASSGVPGAGLQPVGGQMGGGRPALLFQQPFQQPFQPPIQPQYSQQQQQQPLPSLGGLSSLGSGGFGSGSLGGSLHMRQPSLGSAPSRGTSMLGNVGILDSAKDNSFNFVDDAITAAKRKN